jgi:hypothetical protein
VAKVNFRQQKRQRELARKERQSQRLLRRGEQPPETDPGLVKVPGQSGGTP